MYVPEYILKLKSSVQILVFYLKKHLIQRQCTIETLMTRAYIEDST